MPQVGLEATIPVIERAKTVHDLDGAATVIGKAHITKNKNRNIDSIRVISSFGTFAYILKVTTVPHLFYAEEVKITVLYDETPRSLADCEDARFILPPRRWKYRVPLEFRCEPTRLRSSTKQKTVYS
jgi:hypothetical protein